MTLEDMVPVAELAAGAVDVETATGDALLDHGLSPLRAARSR